MFLSNDHNEHKRTTLKNVVLESYIPLSSFLFCLRIVEHYCNFTNINSSLVADSPGCIFK